MFDAIINITLDVQNGVIMTDETVRTTIAIPLSLLTATDKAVREGKAKSRNEFFATSLRRELALLERSAVDSAFSGMAGDGDYRDESRRLAQEFAASDWEALDRADQPQ